MNLSISNYDIVFFGIILSSSLLAFIRGGVTEILSLSTWFIAFWAMSKFGYLIDRFIPLNINNNLIRNIIIFVIAFILVAIFIAILKKLLINFFQAIGLGGVNRLIGIAFGILRGIILCAIMVLVIEILRLDTTHTWQNSRLYPILKPTVTWIGNHIPKNFDRLAPMSAPNVDIYKNLSHS